MKIYLIILLFVLLASCEQNDSLNYFYLTEYHNYKEFDDFLIPESIIKIENDSIVFCYFKCIFQDKAYKIIPSLHVDQLNKQDKKQLIKSISECDLFINLKKTRDCMNLVYDLSCKLNDTKVREVCVDSTKFDDNFKSLIAISWKIADTLKLNKVDYYKYHEKFNIVEPPATNEYQLIHP